MLQLFTFIFTTFSVFVTIASLGIEANQFAKMLSLFIWFTSANLAKICQHNCGFFVAKYWFLLEYKNFQNISF